MNISSWLRYLIWIIYYAFIWWMLSFLALRLWKESDNNYLLYKVNNLDNWIIIKYCDLFNDA